MKTLLLALLLTFSMSSHASNVEKCEDFILDQADSMESAANTLPRWIVISISSIFVSPVVIFGAVVVNVWYEFIQKHQVADKMKDYVAQGCQK